MQQFLRSDCDAAEARGFAEIGDLEDARRLLAVASAYEGCDLNEIAWDAEVPPETVIDWMSCFLNNGLDGLLSWTPPVSGLTSEYDAEKLARLAATEPNGLSKTALNAVSMAYRGMSSELICRHYQVPAEELSSWIYTFNDLGPQFLAQATVDTKHHGPKAKYAEFKDNRGLRFDYNAAFLRKLLVKATGDYASRLNIMALLYEGRTTAQVCAIMSCSSMTIANVRKAFLKRGLFGLITRSKQVRIPSNRDYDAVKVRALLKETTNAAYRKRLMIVEAAYRAVDARTIAEKFEVEVSNVRNMIRLFGNEGPSGLAYGEAELTPPLREDYDAARIRGLMEGETTREVLWRFDVIARLYEGQSMREVAVHLFAVTTWMGIKSVRYFVERFNSIGREFAYPFYMSQAPDKPGITRHRFGAPSPDSDIDRPLMTIDLRRDFSAEMLSAAQEMVRPGFMRYYSAIIEAYNGADRRTIAATRPGMLVGDVDDLLAGFNANGVGWMMMAKPPSRALERRYLRQQNLRAIVVQKITDASRWKEISKLHAVPTGLAAYWKASEQIQGKANESGTWVALRDDYDQRWLERYICRVVDDRYRKAIETIRMLYILNGKVAKAAERCAVSEYQVRAISEAFNADPPLMRSIFTRRPGAVLYERYDEGALMEALKSRSQPLQTYAKVVSWLYAGQKPSVVREKFDLKKSELAIIVATFNKRGVAGLADDPLGVGTSLDPLPKPKTVEQTPPRSIVPPSRPAQTKPRAPEKAPATVPVAHREIIQEAYRVPFADRIRSFAEVASGPHRHALIAIALISEGVSLEETSSRTQISPRDVREWVEYYNKNGTLSFLSEDKASPRPITTDTTPGLLRRLSNAEEDEAYVRRMLIVADALDGDTMPTICHRHEVTYQFAASCITRFGMGGLTMLAVAENWRENKDARWKPTPPVDPKFVARGTSSSPSPRDILMRPAKPLTGNGYAGNPKKPQETLPKLVAPPVAKKASKGSLAKLPTIFAGRGNHRLSAVKDFYQTRDIDEVAKRHNVGKATLEKWILTYVRSGMGTQADGFI